MHIIFSIIYFIVTQQMEHWNEKSRQEWLLGYTGSIIDSLPRPWFFSQIFNLNLYIPISVCIFSIHFQRCWHKSYLVGDLFLYSCNLFDSGVIWCGEKLDTGQSKESKGKVNILLSTISLFICTKSLFFPLL